MKKVTTNLRKVIKLLLLRAPLYLEWRQVGDTDIGLALVGKNSKGTQARKQNIAKQSQSLFS